MPNRAAGCASRPIDDEESPPAPRRADPCRSTAGNRPRESPSLTLGRTRGGRFPRLHVHRAEDRRQQLTEHLGAAVRTRLTGDAVAHVAPLLLADDRLDELRRRADRAGMLIDLHLL